MSARGGRGGGRGGRGGARGGKKGGPAGLPWDYDPNTISDQPQELYPKTYHPPIASSNPLTPSETRAVRCLVKFRRDFHNSKLYTHRHLAPESTNASSNFSDPVWKSYGQEQVNRKYGVKSKATTDPFHAVPMYNHLFVSETRAMPDLRDRLFNYDLFPEELWPTLDCKDGGPKAPVKKKKRKSAVLDDPFAEDEDEDGDPVRRRRLETDEDRKRRIEEAAADKQNEEDVGDEEDEDDEAEMSQQDDDFGDEEDGGDYDAEAYFDGGDDDVEDEGAGEAAVDLL